MKPFNRISAILFIGLLLILIPFTFSCTGSKEKQDILNYIEEMMPVMEAETEVNEAHNQLTRRTDLSYQEVYEEIQALLIKTENIYLDVDSSIAPPVMREFKRKWSKSCQLKVQALSLTLQGLLEENFDLIREGDNLLFEANNVKTDMQEELYDLFIEYNIDTNELF